MKLTCEVEVVYSLAVANGGVGSRSHRARASLSLGKKTGGNPSGGRSREELFLIVSTAKNVSGTKYKVELVPSSLDNSGFVVEWLKLTSVKKKKMECTEPEI